ncbi:hypothetical protein [Burkholderia ambifaria]|nr:hypothetical protein [Burkholderia ambifaria]
MFIVGDALGHERIASSLYSGRMLKSFPLGGAVRRISQVCSRA